ncbi:unnamed protein product [Adineta steineri]|uniref:Transient receptor ion channel domain-containing protein n=1 Tax=Adineta steineri TaxID=433720 RepID=A0A814YTR6_9BILA|nr:unnamed protein product [Adineta steineri]CAF1409033.1 unnamed protein product [Adineta steineri]
MNHHRSNSTRRGSVSSSTSRTYYNKTFEDTTDLFLFACAHGDYTLVHRLLLEGEVKADVMNKMGKSALQLAIENEHFEVVKVLLDKTAYEKFRDALLLAIYLGHTNIADFIMNHPTYLTFYGGFLDVNHPQAYDDSQFSSDITPLILAAQHNRLQIVHQLLTKGERIKKPHASMCPCVDCADSSAYDSFRQAQVRLSAYKGLSSEVYIALTYPDPILQAFELSHELRTLAKVEHYFREDYEKLANQLSVFVTRLLDNVRGHEELEIVLNKTGKPNEEKYENLARFDLAIQYQEKAFVSHSNCQQKLMEKWYENLSAIKNAHLTKRVLFYLAFIICLPFLLLAYYLFPKSKIGSLCHQPNLKLKTYIISYLTFIGLIVASSYFSVSHLQETRLLSNEKDYDNYIRYIYQNIELRNALISKHNNNNNNRTDNLISCDVSLRFMEPNPFQIAIFIWVVGFIWQEFKQVFTSGMRVYLTAHSNYVDCSMNILYILYFIFLYSSMIYTRTSMKTFRSEKYWEDIKNFNSLTSEKQDHYLAKTYHILYWLNADRYYWNSGDAQNLAEAFFAMGNVASICRICFLLPIIGFVGPLQVMLERMLIDISKWIVIILIFFIAFACSLYLIFSFFAVAREQQIQLRNLTSLNGHKSFILSSITNNTIIIQNNSKCPQLFYDLMENLNETMYYIENDDSNETDNKNTCACEDDKNYETIKTSENYDKIKRVGPRPALYYFGDSFGSTILTTFFTLFGVIAEDGVPDRSYELISLTCNKPNKKTYAPGFDLFTSNLGFIIYGLFTFVCVTVLINTLIAMMEETIDTIDDRADVEWKFARSRLYMEYIRDGNTLPVPLNICPTPKSFIYQMKRLKQKLFSDQSATDDNERANKDKEDQIGELNIRHRNNVMNGGKSTLHNNFENDRIFDHSRNQMTDEEKLTYKIVTERIVKRFLLYYKNKHNAMDEINDGMEFKEFKNDISSLRFELFNEVDVLDEMRLSLIQSMKKLNDDLQGHFDIEQIKNHFNNQRN